MGARLPRSLAIKKLLTFAVGSPPGPARRRKTRLSTLKVLLFRAKQNGAFVPCRENRENCPPCLNSIFVSWRPYPWSSIGNTAANSRFGGAGSVDFLRTRIITMTSAAVFARRMLHTTHHRPQYFGAGLPLRTL